MTCIVGLVEDGRVYIGGDSAGVGGDYSLMLRADRKVFRNGDFIFGFSSSFRMGQLLQHVFEPPKRHPDTTSYVYMVKDFIPAVRECFKAGGYAKKENEVESGGFFLVGHAGHLFKVEPDYQVGEALDPFDVCGCGGDVALGALFASTEVTPLDRVRAALKAAERFSAGVRGPFHFETLERPK